MRDLLRQSFRERVRFDEPLGPHTSFRIGGPADAWIEVQSAREISELQRLAAEANVRLCVLGTGTNVLVSDRGVRGLVVKLGAAFARLAWQSEGERERVRAGAALPFKKLVVEAARRGLGGLEFAEGIPGSIGGGLLMNAGAFGGEISNVVASVVVVDPASGERVLDGSELRFGYRRFDLPPGLIVTHVDFVLGPADPEAVRRRMQDAKRRRASNQPLGLPNAGSVFKNPPGDYAGRLIEAAGMKGRRVGGAMVSEQHANFIVNLGRATAADVKQLMDEISAAVWQAKAIRLVPEIKLVGEWERP
jgi:UDP-N-acetylmuramate dehydrogenase